MIGEVKVEKTPGFMLNDWCDSRFNQVSSTESVSFVTQNDGALDHILQFTNVAGPSIGLKQSPGH